VHQEVDAVAVCKSCGRGVCSDCAITISGNTFCKSCVESQKAVVTPTTPVVKERTGVITAASILFIIFGILGLLGSLVIIGLGALATEIPLFGGFIGGIIILIGMVGLILAILDIIAGGLLWSNKKSGGILGLILSIIGLIFGLLTTSIGFGIINVVLSLILIVLIAVGWNTLQ